MGATPVAWLRPAQHPRPTHTRIEQRHHPVAGNRMDGWGGGWGVDGAGWGKSERAPTDTTVHFRAGDDG